MSLLDPSILFLIKISHYSANMMSSLQKCVGKQSCSVTVAAEVFGGDPCPDSSKKLSVEAVCT